MKLRIENWRISKRISSQLDRGAPFDGCDIESLKIVMIMIAIIREEFRKKKKKKTVRISSQLGREAPFDGCDIESRCQ